MNVQAQCQKPLILGVTIGVPILLIMGVLYGTAKLSQAWQTFATVCIDSFTLFSNSLIHYGGIWIILSLSVLGTGLVWGFSFLLYQWYKVRKLKRSLGKKSLSREQQGVPFWLVPDARSFALTIGLHKPEIYISKGLKNRLSRKELEAVIAHEEFHRFYQHPLILLFIHTLNKFLFFLPIFRRISAHIKFHQEISADKAAVNATSQKTVIAVILKLFDDSYPIETVPVGIAGFSMMKDRVEYLLNKDKKKNVRLPVPFVMLSLVMLLVVQFYFLVPVPHNVYAHDGVEEAIHPTLSSGHCINQKFSLQTFIGFPNIQQTSFNRTPLK